MQSPSNHQLRVSLPLQVVITSDPNAQCTPEVLPVTYDKFASMVQPGDSIFVGRYLVTGADDSSLFLEVRWVAGGGGGGVFCESVGRCLITGADDSSLEVHKLCEGR